MTMEEENIAEPTLTTDDDQLDDQDRENLEPANDDLATTTAASSPDGEQSEIPSEQSDGFGSVQNGVSSPIARIKQQARHMRTSSFQRWKKQMQRAWRWGPGGGDPMESLSSSELLKATVNFEVMANQKRQWYQINSKSQNNRQYEEPTSLFEHFFIVGLHSCANVEPIEDAFAKKKAWESNVAKSEILDLRNIHYHGAMPTLEPQILFKYPPGKKADIRETDLPSFCFPDGVKARLIERTPSMSELNEVVFGQDHLSRDDQCFIFRTKVADNATLYGVCLQVQEIVQRPPGILGSFSPSVHNSYKPSRFLVSAPRCYCLLTRVPFFELHYEMLNSIIAQERLDRITQFAKEITLSEPIPHSLTDSSESLAYTDWMEHAIPVQSISGLLYSPEPGPGRETPSFMMKNWGEPQSPESVDTSETSETSESRSDSFERVGGFENIGRGSPESSGSGKRVIMDRVESLEFESLHSLVRGAGSDEDEDFLSSKSEIYASDEKIMEWAKANNNEPLQIVCGYHSLNIPPRGSDIVFHPLEHLQPINYHRSQVSYLGYGDFSDFASPDNQLSFIEKNEVKLRLAAAEEALALSVWTISTLCRTLSIENVLALFAGTLLEKQVIVICPNLGVLSAIVLSVIPMIRPFEWQSLLLPVMPRKMLDLLDAPVPFIAGITHKPSDLKMKTANVVRINAFKDQVKTCSLPQLPRYKELISELTPLHTKICSENYLAQRHPNYRCSENQAEAAGEFINVMRRYLESLCSEMRSHTITNVQSNNDRVSLLLKDSFIDSFPIKDRPFMKLFIDTQMFSVQSDSRLATFEAEQ
ncbi:hypothetical protein LUZ60_015013 [Juncus effusus]|nr:hypothetical protein LUZ60_015013 [Juncus effusus]